jgi:hypothetical protein
MSKYLAGLAALTLMGAAALPLQANAAERHHGISSNHATTTLSAQRHWRHGGYRHWGPRYGYWRHRYWGPRYGYYGSPYYGYGYPYGYYRPGPFVSFGVGPFGFRVF